MSRGRVSCGLACALALTVLCDRVAAQPAATAQQAPPERSDAPRDALGRDSPRGTVVGFMNAARKGNHEAAALYLNTRQTGGDRMELARQLYVVLDSRLPARLNELSTRSEGSLSNPLKPDQDLVGTIATGSGSLDILVERVVGDGSEPVWLFARATLDAIPDVYDEVRVVSLDRFIPAFLPRPRVLGIRLFQWLALIAGLPFAYGLLGAVSRPFAPLFAPLRRRFGGIDTRRPDGLPGYVRLLLLAVVIGWILASVDLPLIERRLWSIVSVFLATAAIVWMLLRLNVHGETYLAGRVQASSGEMASMLRLLRRVADIAVIVGAGLVLLGYFGIDATAALAGLGIGGIAVALAAQKTLENVIGGLSIIFDKAVRVGDSLKLDQTVGTVDYIGLRSTRIRTLDRTIVSVPNGQIANAAVETLSARDKFRFQHVVGLQYDTTAAQMRAVLTGVRARVVDHPSVEVESVRVQFLRLGASSLDVEVLAYIFADNWDGFLAIQQELLLAIMDIVSGAGTAIAFPTQTLLLSDAQSPPRVGERVTPADGAVASPSTAPTIARATR